MDGLTTATVLYPEDQDGDITVQITNGQITRVHRLDGTFKATPGFGLMDGARQGDRISIRTEPFPIGPSNPKGSCYRIIEILGFA